MITVQLNLLQVELREGFSVQEILMGGDRVTGIRGRDGATVSEEAHIVVGADGKRSVVARAVETPEYYVKPTLADAGLSERRPLEEALADYERQRRGDARL
jgi:flavin-dependent dehydrogenase